MTNLRPLRAAMLALTGLLAACGYGADAPEPLSAETVFHGGLIYTGDADRPLAGAVSLDGQGRVLAVYPLEGAAELVFVETAELVDLDGAVMFPGFVDAHAHLSGIGERELRLDLSGTDSVAALVTRIEAVVSESPAERVIFGRGWIETGWPEGRMPVAVDLDGVSPRNPVILVRADGHALVANSAALALAGITADTIDPEGGRIERGADGAPNGLLIDDAMGLVAGLIDAPTDADRIAALVTGGDVYVSRGWTGVHNMSVSVREAELMERLSLEGRLPLRIANHLDAEGFELAARRAHGTDTVTNRGVKIYMDGALGSRGAQLIAPYADRPGEMGLSLTSDAELRQLMTRADRAEIDLAIHAIGDLANRRILNACDETGLCNGKRWRIEHAQVIALEDLNRLAGLDLIASMQPSHAIGDLYFAPDRLGPERLAGAYAWSDLLANGTIVTGGSDAPVEVGSPLIEFYAAVARAGLDGFQGEGWHPEQAVDRATALSMFTSAPAYASHREADLGVIAPGKLADFTVFDRDLMTIPAPEILEAQAVMTVIGGEIVWQSDLADPTTDRER